MQINNRDGRKLASLGLMHCDQFDAAVLHARPERQAETWSADFQTIEDERRIKLAEAVNHLPDRQRNVFILRYWHDWTVERISKEIGFKIGTVSSDFHKAVEALKPLLPVPGESR